jgi:hypothetical protein
MAERNREYVDSKELTDKLSAFNRQLSSREALNSGEWHGQTAKEQQQRILGEHYGQNDRN